jgi:ubiquinone/menaquinone biosynthesis C-methylase UbiE
MSGDPIRDDWRGRINSTAHDCYTAQGEGAGADGGALDWLQDNTDHHVQDGHNCIEIGFGGGRLLDRLAKITSSKVVGYDIAEACLSNYPKEHGPVPSNVKLHIEDVCHHELDYPDGMFDFAFCTESIEHFTNPYFAVAEVKRVLRHNGIFTIAFPMPEDNLGYGGGDHAHVYPGFLQQASFERFMKQLYFKQVFRKQNGSSAWYVFRSYDGPDMVDLFTVVSGNYDEEALYGLLDRDF